MFKIIEVKWICRQWSLTYYESRPNFLIQKDQTCQLKLIKLSIVINLIILINILNHRYVFINSAF